MEVIAGKFGKRAPLDLAFRLRGLADQIDAGEITTMVIAYVDERDDGDYRFVWGASMQDSIVLTTLLMQSAIDRMRG